MALVLLWRGEALAQEGAEPDWPIDPASYPRPAHAATKARGPIVIDGRPDEAAWQETVPITRFVQTRPELGFPATERTEARILYDEDALYISCLCYDTQPDKLTVSSLERDFGPLDSDVFSFVLNPDPSRWNSFLFYVNPAGALGDAQTFDDNRILNYAWDGVVEVATELTDFGWTVEMAIPWTTLRFDGAQGTQDWGFNVQRRVRRINESATWSPLQRHEFQPKVSRAGTLTGLEGLKQGRDLRLKPYVRGSVASGGGAVGGAGDELETGLDLKYGITSRLTFDATYRTDFSHVEVDQLQVNLTRFPLFFPERREFFIENSGIFEFGDGTRGEYRSSVSARDFTLFHTRRVGLTSAGEVIPIVGGTRLSGSLGQFEVGVLGMRTDAAGERTREDFGVVRLRRRLLGRSDVGFIVTNRNLVGEDGAPVYNRTYGADANLNLAEHLLLTSYIAMSDAPDLVGGRWEDRSAVRVSAGWRDPFWNTSVLFRRFGSEFTPGMGFVRRRGMNHSYATFGVHPSFDRLALQEINPYVEIDYYTNLQSVLETRSVRTGLGFTFDDGSRSSLTYESLYERIFKPFRVSGSALTVALGAYETQMVSASHQSNPARTLSANVSVSRGGYFDGTQTSYGVGGAWRPSSRVALQVAVSRNEIELPAGNLVADLARFELNLNPTTRLSTSALIQYNGLTDEVVSNVRLRFIHAPLSDLYLVYSELRRVGEGVGVDHSIALKVTRLFAF